MVQCPRAQSASSVQQAGLFSGQAGNRIGDHRAPPPALVLADFPGDRGVLGRVWEVSPADTVTTLMLRRSVRPCPRSRWVSATGTREQGSARNWACSAGWLAFTMSSHESRLVCCMGARTPKGGNDRVRGTLSHTMRRSRAAAFPPVSP